MIGPYDAPETFRIALETRLRNTAQSRGTDLQRLRRRVAFERLLARLFVQDDPPWLLKGGYALELRLQDQARSTLDLDISVPDPGRIQLLTEMGKDASPTEAVYEHIQQVAEYDLDDGFRFLIGRPKKERAGAPAGSVRCSVEARLAGRTFARFHLDIGLGDPVLNQPDWLEGSAYLAFAGIPAARVAAYPLDQQFAEKIHAYTFPWQDRDNTRVKDLVDLVLLVHLGRLNPDHIKRALVATFKVRDTHPLPDRLPEPPLAWAEPYAAIAQELELPASTLQEAYVYLDVYWQRLESSSAGESDH
ncbi:MAG: nucleotidyl transferase AbiEii/AbiGii toxin family protein [Chloroflexi bacterium]|nr:nucleotidyl transferase AbiEii/AbiGii toxin family protein [Chloroflexota bacterium]